MEERAALYRANPGTGTFRRCRRCHQRGSLLTPKRMRTITLIIVHCSANTEGSVLRQADIRAWHLRKGWKDCGYHFVIPTDGTIETGRPIEQPGAHCKNHNRHSIGVCYIGGLAPDGKTLKDTRTHAQREALRTLLQQLHAQFPKALILGHRDLDPRKACPCYEVAEDRG